MDRDEVLSSIMKPGLPVKMVEDDIYSSIAEATPHHYDKLAAIYDLIIGSWPYNRIIWGNWPKAYADYCASAVNSGGVMLDAGCGTLVFTADVYAQTKARVVVVDRSIEMLRRARKRLSRFNGQVPNNIILFQGDLFQLPFKNSSFDTVMSWAVLHLFDEISGILKEMRRVRKDEGKLFVTSLVKSKRVIGNQWLNILHKGGEVAKPISGAELEERFTAAVGSPEISVKGNVAYLALK